MNEKKQPRGSFSAEFEGFPPEFQQQLPFKQAEKQLLPFRSLETQRQKGDSDPNAYSPGKSPPRKHEAGIKDETNPEALRFHSRTCLFQGFGTPSPLELPHVSI